MGDLLVVSSKVKDAIKNADCHTAGDLDAALSKKVEQMLKEACNRAKANDRKTVRASDL